MRRTRRLRALILLALVGAATLTASAPWNRGVPDDEAAVRAVAQAYLDGLLHGDVATLESAFHPETRFEGAVGDALVSMTFRDWAESRRGREMRPVEDYRHSIEDVLISGDAAVVRTDIDWPQTYFVDYLSLLRIDGEWKIVNKTWTQRPAPRALSRIEDRPLESGPAAAYAGVYRSGGSDGAEGVELRVSIGDPRLRLSVQGKRWELYYQGEDTFAPEFDVEDRLRFERQGPGPASRLHLILDDTTLVADRVGPDRGQEDAAEEEAGRPHGAEASGLGPTAAAALEPADVAAIDSFVAAAMEELNVVPGLGLAVVRGGAPVHEAGYGYRDRERGLPVTPNTLFYTASLAKAFTGATAAVLDAEGILDLDAHLVRFFPELDTAPPVDADATTLRDLLRHGKPFRNGAVNFYSSFVGAYTRPELIRVLNQYSEPSEGFAYSNTAYALAGYAIESATDRDWRDVMRERVFEPLDMRRSTARLAEVDSADFAVPYLARADGIRRIALHKSDRTITGAGGIFSSAHDLARFVVAQLDGGVVDGRRRALPAAAVTEMQTPQIDVDRTFFEFERYAYGLGLYRARWEGEELVHHFGGFPGFRSHLSFMPERGIGVVVLQNEGVDGNRFADVVATYVYDRLRGRPDADARGRRRLDELAAAIEERRERRRRQAGPAPVDVAPGRPSLSPSAYAGEYVSERLGTIRVEPAGEGLRLVWGDIDAPMLPAGDGRFTVPWIPGFQPIPFSFVTDGNGEIQRLDWNARRFVRRS